MSDEYDDILNGILTSGDAANRLFHCREQVEELTAQLAALTAERDALKARVDDLTIQLANGVKADGGDKP